MKIDVYTVCWNEEDLLPLCLKHDQRIADRIFIYDNRSDDATAEIIDAHPLCERREFDTGGEIRDDLLLEIKNHAWKKSRRTADWVIVCDVDEFLYHPDLLGYLASCSQRGITILQPSGFNMFSEEYARADRQIWERIKTGRPDRLFSKKAIDPVKIREINYQPGSHLCDPVGRVREEKTAKLKLLHYRYIGGIEPIRERWADYGERLSQLNKSRGWGLHSANVSEAVERYHDEKKRAKPIDLEEQVRLSEPSRIRVLFLAEAVTLSHVVRPAVLARGLDSERYEAILACDPRYDSLLGDLPVERIRLQSLPADEFLRRIYHNEPVLDVETLDRHVQQDLRLIDQLSPDVIVGDMRQSLAISGKLAGIPYVNIMNAHWSPYAEVEFELAEHPMIQFLGEPLSRLIFQIARPVGFALHTLPLNLIRLKYGLSALGIDMKEVYAYGDYTVYPEVPEVIPMRPLPSNHQYLGPVLWSPEVTPPAWWEEVQTDRPIVYVSLGSSGQAKLLAVMLKALADLPLTVIGATASRSQLQSLPANAYIADYLPGEAAARRAALVISNGGTMSTQQALAAGTPVLGVASNMDQLVFMKAISETKAGEALREGKADVMTIKHVVWRMLEEKSYRQSAERISQAYRRYNPSHRLQELIDQIMVEN